MTAIFVTILATIVLFGFLFWLFKACWSRRSFWFAMAGLFAMHAFLMALFLIGFRKTPWGLLLVLLPIENYGIIWILEKQGFKVSD